jgi:hypothetical protein
LFTKYFFTFSQLIFFKMLSLCISSFSSFMCFWFSYFLKMFSLLYSLHRYSCCFLCTDLYSCLNAEIYWDKLAFFGLKVCLYAPWMFGR